MCEKPEHLVSWYLHFVAFARLTSNFCDSFVQFRGNIYDFDDVRGGNYVNKIIFRNYLFIS